jgi:Domain of unknown function (DUF4287)
MTFQAYLDNIHQKTGKTPADFHALAKKAGPAGPELTASQLVAWLKKEFGLGHGHSMALWAVFKSKGWVAGETRRSRSGPARASAR